MFLVNDILDHSQQESNKLVLNMDQVVDLVKTIKECIEILAFKAEMKRIELKIEVSENFPSEILIDG